MDFNYEREGSVMNRYAFYFTMMILIAQTGCNLDETGQSDIESVDFASDYPSLFAQFSATLDFENSFSYNQVAWPTYVVGKTVVRIEHLGIVNILAGKTVVPELVQQDLTPETLSQQMAQWMQQDDVREALLAELQETVAQLGKGGAYDRAAQAVLGTMTNPHGSRS